MNKLFCTLVGSSAFLLFSTTSQATEITTGDLNYDSATGIITDTASTASFLGWDTLAGLTYQQTLDYTADDSAYEGGKYAGYHVASQSEAAAFINAAFGSSCAGWCEVSTAKGGFGGDFPNIYTDYIDVWFLSEQASDYAGYLSINYDYFTNGNEGLAVNNDFGSITYADSLIGNSTPGTAWLLVNDTASVPEPMTLSLFGLGLAGLSFVRRQRQS